MKNGGPAFPGPATHDLDGNKYGHSGISMRDYFAIHGDQPGQLEISNAAGIQLRDYSPLPFNDPERLKLPTWHDWFDALDQTTRLALYAKVRYQIADAMLTERDRK